MIHDIRYAIRMLFKNPLFLAVAVLSLGIGIAANTTVFSVINAIVLAPPAVRDPGSLVAVYTSDFSGPRYGSSSYPDFLDFRSRGALDDLAAYRMWPPLVSIGDSVERAQVAAVSGNYFPLLGVTASIGRTFALDEPLRPGEDSFIVLSNRYWRRRFAADPAVVGRTVNLNSRPFTIAGVLPPEFTGVERGNTPDAWIPLSMSQGFNFQQRGSRGLRLIGRLRPGSSIEQVRAEFAALAAQLQEAYGPAWTDRNSERRVITVIYESESRVPPPDRALIFGGLALILSVMALVLLIACVNVASLLLARAVSRQREIAIRLSLGAKRVRVFRQLLIESFLLAITAGTFSVLLTAWVISGLELLQDRFGLPATFVFALDQRVVTFAAGISLLTGVIFGFVPAIQSSRVSLATMAKGDATGGHWSRSRMRNAFVAAQIALSFLLLIGAGLFLRSLSRASNINPGFDPENILLFSTDMRAQGYQQPVVGRALQVRLLEQLRSTPGVESVTLADTIPLTLGRQRQRVWVDGYAEQRGEDMEHHFAIVGPDYFHVLRIPIIRGHGFTDADREGSAGVVVVNEAFARKFWPGEDPLGKRMRAGSDAFSEVIGVARDSKYYTLAEEVVPFFYRPALQTYIAAPTFLVRTAGAPAQMIPSVRARVRGVDSALLLFDIQTLTDATSISLLGARAIGSILGVTGFVALLLAVIGIYGVVAYAFQQRTHEMGIRIALGAQRRDVVGLVLSHGMKLAATGMGIGLVAAFGTTHLLKSFLYDVSPTDPLSFALTVIVLFIAAILASYLPARRAAQVDPVVALREE
ncbi:MAG: ABC transporter permease [Acidobacteria bacterium]|nr:ABC transporter permease [Acidobacteriota bacterium]